MAGRGVADVRDHRSQISETKERVTQGLGTDCLCLLAVTTSMLVPQVPQTLHIPRELLHVQASPVQPAPLTASLSSSADLLVAQARNLGVTLDSPVPFTSHTQSFRKSQRLSS